MKEKNFKFRASLGKLVEKMTDKQAGEFIKAVSGYAFKGNPFETKDEYLKGVYLYVQNLLDTEARSMEYGKKGADKLAEMRRNAKTNGVGIVVITEQKVVDKVE